MIPSGIHPATQFEYGCKASMGGRSVDKLLRIWRATKGNPSKGAKEKIEFAFLLNSNPDEQFQAVQEQLSTYDLYGNECRHSLLIRVTSRSKQSRNSCPRLGGPISGVTASHLSLRLRRYDNSSCGYDRSISDDQQLLLPPRPVWGLVVGFKEANY
ncbi:unnamed protein product [Nippostrongylus brasiliensis]|uniref:Uncharacterized protein n=1 Tax=Nippostrongylus brasiliensis TaxID=27835 RepID=A0A0N4YGP0_NIPBR|nr:unnamed protein product [Nippostrongylus brasiliensis]